MTDKRTTGVAPQVAVPGEVFDEATGSYEGEALAQIRARRPTDERIGRLERKHDQLAGDVSDIKATVGEIRGEMKVWPKLIEQLKDTVSKSLERDHVTFKAQVDVDRAAATADVEVAKAKALDPIEARKAKREWITKALAIIGTLASAVLLALQARSC